MTPQRGTPQLDRNSPDRFITRTNRTNYHLSRTADATAQTPRALATASRQTLEQHIARALELDTDDTRILHSTITINHARRSSFESHTVDHESVSVPKWPVEIKPFKILDAPALSDDFYTTNLAGALDGEVAVALGIDVHLWSETAGQKQIPGSYIDALTGSNANRAPVTALAYSFNNRWLAIARKDGLVQLFGRFEWTRNAEIQLRGDIACMSFRPSTPRESNSRDLLLIGGFKGDIYCLTIDLSLPDVATTDCHVVSVIETAHTEQITGLTWHQHGQLFASGGNDNVSCIFYASNMSSPRFRFRHSAAIKALAFCPFEDDILAVGGGSQDQTIKFFNTKSGNLIRSIKVEAQVTSIFWSSRYQEFVTTFGYSVGQSQIKAKVYTWPDLRCVIVIPLPRQSRVDARVIHAIMSLEQSAQNCYNTSENLIITSSDETIRFYKIFGTHRATEHKGIGLGGGRVLADQDLHMLSPVIR